MEISAWNPMNRARRKKGPTAGLMTRERCHPESFAAVAVSRRLCLLQRIDVFFLLFFSFLLFSRSVAPRLTVSTRCDVSFFFRFFFFYTRQKFRTHARNQGPIIIFYTCFPLSLSIFLSTGGRNYCYR